MVVHRSGTADASSYNVLYVFGNHVGSSPTPYVPRAALIDVNGTLYGTTQAGGVTADAGTVFSMSTAGEAQVLHSFTYSAAGKYPFASLIDVDGILYGTTSAKGLNGGGAVFAVSTAGTVRVLHGFGGGSDGTRPYASLIDVNGALYGTTYGGGTHGQGTVFSITTSGTEHVLHSFNGDNTDGWNPNASLTDVNGTLYGTTVNGGASGQGTVFSITTSGSEHVLYSFSGIPDGGHPSASLIDVNGTLYGTTVLGGTHGDGTIFSMTTSGRESVLHSFSGHPSDGANPHASLIDVKGTLYGTTSSGGANGLGTVFSFGTIGKAQVLHSFTGYPSDGANPNASLIDVKGMLYGTTSFGGTYKRGTAFTLSP